MRLPPGCLAPDILEVACSTTFFLTSVQFQVQTSFVQLHLTRLAPATVRRASGHPRSPGTSGLLNPEFPRIQSPGAFHVTPPIRVYCSAGNSAGLGGGRAKSGHLSLGRPEFY